MPSNSQAVPLTVIEKVFCNVKVKGLIAKCFCHARYRFCVYPLFSEEINHSTPTRKTVRLNKPIDANEKLSNSNCISLELIFFPSLVSRIISWSLGKIVISSLAYGTQTTPQTHTRTRGDTPHTRTHHRTTTHNNTQQHTTTHTHTQQHTQSITQNQQQPDTQQTNQHNTHAIIPHLPHHTANTHTTNRRPLNIPAPTTTAESFTLITSMPAQPIEYAFDYLTHFLPSLLSCTTLVK